MPSLSRGHLLTISMRTGLTSVISEVEVVEEDGVWRLLVIAVNLVINGHAKPPWLWSLRLEAVNVRHVAVEGNRFEQDLVVARPLHSQNQAVPLAADRVARYARLDPMFV